MKKGKIKILLTGSNSFLGKQVKNKLLKEGYILNCLIRKHKSSKGRVNNIKFDINDKKTIENTIKDSDYIIHMASITKADDKEIYKVNVGYTKTLVEFSKKYSIKKFIYISSSNVSTNFKDNYTISKKKAEIIVKTLENYIILRPTILYGPGDNRYINKFINLIKNFRIVPLINKGNQIIYPLYINDLTNIICNFLLKKNRSITYLILGDKISYKDLALLISKKLNIMIVFFPIPIFFIKFLSKIQGFFMKPFITQTQINNLISCKEFKKDNIFKFNPLKIEKGIDIILKNDTPRPKGRGI